MRTLEALKPLVVPTPVQLVLSFVLALSILFVTHVQLFVSLLASKAYVPREDVGTVVSTHLIDLSHLPYAEKVSVGLFWAVVASLVYIAAVGANNALIEARNQYVIDTQFANEQGHRGYWVRSTAARLGWVALFIGLIGVTVSQLLPLWLDLFGRPFAPASVGGWWQPPLAIAGLTINIYGLWMLVRAIRATE